MSGYKGARSFRFSLIFTNMYVIKKNVTFKQFIKNIQSYILNNHV